MPGKDDAAYSGHEIVNRENLLDRIRRWDARTFMRVNSWKGRAVSWLKYYTHIGFFGTWASIIITMTIVSWVGHLGLGWLLVEYLYANLGSATIMTIIKHKIDRQRPCLVLDDVTVRTHERFYKGSSFPSGHTQFFLSNMLLVTMVVEMGLPGSLVPMLIITIGMTVLVALSRIYIGVHYPSDVIVAFATGILIFLLTVFLFFPFVFEPLYGWLRSLIH
ncbi:phosphatase PAP2 family protein [Candidatus Bathyarchaeota archaeon]|nr:phosphatase PAP2 family protein [Candidatus Bathyarchaeota archaeon]